MPLCASGVPHENVLYIAGIILPDRRIGIAAVAPQCLTGPGFYRTDADAHVSVLKALRTYRLQLVGQVHCHPWRYVSHSELDDEEAIVRAAGHWSLVVPHYGTRGMLPLHRCGVHCYTGGQFRRLTRPAIASRVMIVPTLMDLRGGGE